MFFMRFTTILKVKAHNNLENEKNEGKISHYY